MSITDFGYRKVKHILPQLLVAITLAACGSAKASTTETPSVNSIHTAIAITLTSRAASILSTISPSRISIPETASPTPEASPSSTPSPTPNQSSASSAVVYSSACDSSSYISDVIIPDGTVVAPGEYFVKTWRFQNTGACKWTSDYVITFVSGDDMDGSSSTIDQSVSPGVNADISVTMIAPQDLGTYTGYWKLANEDGVEFGVSVWVQIVVSDDVDTVTPTQTSTNVATYTYAPTAVIIPTDTTVPTSTNTATPVPTDTPTIEPTAYP